MLPTVDFCGLNPTRLLIGANPFGGYSHQNGERDAAMREYYSIGRIVETLFRAETAGINTFVTNNETPHVLESVRKYLASGGKMQWIAQLNRRMKPDMTESIEEAAAIGCRALYFHGHQVEELYAQRDEAELQNWCNCARRNGVVVGVAGHLPDVHAWVNSLDLVDFHAICFFNCGSLHEGKGDTFRLSDVERAVARLQEIKKPCIAYKIMGAGRIDAKMAFDYAFEKIKPTDIVNVGMYRGDKDTMVEDNVATVESILTRYERSSTQESGDVSLSGWSGEQ